MTPNDERKSRESTIVVRNHFKIFDCPQEISSEYIGYAKIYCNNQVWKVMKIAMEALKSKMINADDLNDRLTKLEVEFQLIKANSVEDETPTGIRTFGGLVNEKGE